MKLEEYIKELGDPRRPLTVSKLTRLSGLPPDQMTVFATAWPALPVERRRKIVRELNELAEDNVELDFEAVFRQALSDSDAQVRVKAVEGLWESANRHLIDPLINLLENDPVEEVRVAAATALGRYAVMGEMGELRPADLKKVEETLLGVFENQAEGIEVRRRALESVGVLEGERERAAIETAYHHADRKLRVSAVYAMGRNCDERWLSCLLKELRSEDAEMRFEAAGACGELEDRRAVPSLLPLIADQDIDVRLSAIGALGRIGGKKAIQVLRLCLDHSDERVRDAASTALEEAEFGHDPLGLDLDLDLEF